MARLFTAVELEPAVRAAVVERQAAIAAALRAAGDRDLRLVKPDQLHLTLVFIGEVDAGRVDAIAAALADRVPVEPFVLSMGRPGTFPAQGHPRVLWLGVAEGGAALLRLVDLLADRLEPLGVARERRPFQAHLTLGRWKARASATVHDVLAAMPLHPVVQRVSSVTLFRSQLGPSGAVHTPIVRVALA